MNRTEHQHTPDPTTVDSPRGALASFAAEPAQRPHRRQVWLVVIPLMVAYAAVPFVVPSPPSPEARDFGLFLESDAGQSFMSGNWLLVRTLGRALGLQHRARRRTPLPRVPSAPDEWGLRTRRLGGQRRPVRRLPPPRSVGHPRDPSPARCCVLPGETRPERMDRDRGAQRPERRLGNHRPHTCFLSKKVRGRGRNA
jgi:hypothetical protein